MSRTTLRQALLLRLRRVRHDNEDDGFSIVMVLVVMVLSAGFGAMILSSVIDQDKTSRLTQNRVRALSAAQAGVDSMLATFRTATDLTKLTKGDSGRLIGCDAPVTGSLGGANSYSVTVAYYSVDPATLKPSELTNPDSGKAMLCTNTAGPYNTKDAIRTPRYALVTSTGTATGGNATTTRTLQTTYNFVVQDQNIAGGQIRLYPASSTQASQWCMDAGSSPAPGTAIMLQSCSNTKPPIAQQVWAYRADLSIELVSSVTNPNTAGLCIDTDFVPNTATTGHNSRKDANGAAVSDQMVLKRCAIADAAVCNLADAKVANSTCTASPWNQQWSIDDNAHLEGAKVSADPDDKTKLLYDLDGFCINATSQTSGVALNLVPCTGGTSSAAQTWIPAPSAGAGMAGASNQQLVNFQYFATCLDVTGQNIAATYLILYTCKQNPDPAKVAFNQKFAPAPAVGTTPTSVLLTVTTGGKTYCLKSPGAAALNSSPATAYPTLVQQGTAAGQCPASATGAPSAFVWKVSQRYQDAASTTALAYADRYTIKSGELTSDGKDICLSPGAPNTGNTQYATAVIAKCNGSTGQKWNATASQTGGTMTNTTELTTGN